MDIEIDMEVLAALQQRAEPFMDTPNDVLRRLLGLDVAIDRAVATEPLSAQARSTMSPRSDGLPGAGRTKHSGKSRRAAGELLPLDAYCPHILNALIANGGELRTREVPNALTNLIEPHLRPADRQQDSDGLPVWHSRLGWAGSLCRKDGYLDQQAPRGLWRISESGLQKARESEGNR